MKLRAAMRRVLLRFPVLGQHGVASNQAEIPQIDAALAEVPKHSPSLWDETNEAGEHQLSGGDTLINCDLPRMPHSAVY